MKNEVAIPLGDLLRKEHIILNMASKDRWEAIKELVENLIVHQDLKKEEEALVLDSLFDREETMSTGIGFGVAIPHASASNIKAPLVVFGRSLEGIEFEALDDKPVHFVVLFLLPATQFQTHLTTLSVIARFFNDRLTRESLLKADTEEKIFSILKREKH